MALAFADVAGDDDAHELNGELLKGAAPYHADDLVDHFADDAPPEERVQARTKGATLLQNAKTARCSTSGTAGFNVRGHVHNTEPLRRGRYVNICVEHTEYRPLPLQAVVRLAAALVDGRHA